MFTDVKPILQASTLASVVKAVVPCSRICRNQPGSVIVVRQRSRSAVKTGRRLPGSETQPRLPLSTVRDFAASGSPFKINASTAVLTTGCAAGSEHAANSHSQRWL